MAPQRSRVLIGSLSGVSAGRFGCASSGRRVSEGRGRWGSGWGPGAVSEGVGWVEWARLMLRAVVSTGWGAASERGPVEKPQCQRRGSEAQKAGAGKGCWGRDGRAVFLTRSCVRRDRGEGQREQRWAREGLREEEEVLRSSGVGRGGLCAGAWEWSPRAVGLKRGFSQRGEPGEGGSVRKEWILGSLCRGSLRVRCMLPSVVTQLRV